MKQLLVLSGKGGTGKTTVASAMIQLAQAQAYADCDVDAPNLHLVTSQKAAPQQEDYYALPKAEIQQERCQHCGQCAAHCRFGAILQQTARGQQPLYQVDAFACEGCTVCAYVCPAQAITMKAAAAGTMTLYQEPQKVFSTAQLKMGSGNSGMLVTKVKRRLKKAASCDFAIIDGSPGIGCPVIASLNGADMALLVAEPSISGISDLERIIHTAEIFHVITVVCVNKYDTNLENTAKIEDYCYRRDIPYVGNIPFDLDAVRAINEGKTIVGIDCPAGQAVKEIYAKTMEIFHIVATGF